MTKYEKYQETLKNLSKELGLIKKQITKLSKDLKSYKTNVKPNIIENSKKNIKKLNIKKNELEDTIMNLRNDLMNNLSFNVDEELKIGYLRQKPFETAKADLTTIIALDEFESLINKKVYNFTLTERDELLTMKFKNTTINAVVSTISRIKGYIDYCVSQGKVVHMQNIFDTLIKEEAMKFVSQQATELRYIDKEELKECQKLLANNQDKLILELLYIGVRGRTVKGGTLEEIINLRYNPNHDYSDGLIELERNDGTFRELKVSQEIIDLIRKTYEDDIYLGNNGKEDIIGGSKMITINRYEDYVFCSVGKSKHGKMNPVTINARFQKIQEYCKNPFITAHNLYISGMISSAKDIFNDNGEILIDDYLRICKDFKYGDTPERYYSKVKQEVERYLQEEIKNA